jgi:hypothetical protein
MKISFFSSSARFTVFSTKERCTVETFMSLKMSVGMPSRSTTPSRKRRKVLPPAKFVGSPEVDILFHDVKSIKVNDARPSPFDRCLGKERGHRFPSPVRT